MNRTWKTSELQELSDLHVLAISRASLRAVQAVYNQDPLELTIAVVEDAFCYGASGDVLRFLFKRKELDETEICELVAKRFLAAIPLLQTGSTAAPSKVAETMMNLNDLVHTFPDRLVLSNAGRFCPLGIVLLSSTFPRNLLDSMIATIPPRTLFCLRGNNDLPRDGRFRQQIRTSLDDPRCLRAIGAILEKVEKFILRRSEMTEEEVVKLLLLLCRSTNVTTNVHIYSNAIQAAASASDEPIEEILRPAKEFLESTGGESPIKTFSISYNHILQGPEFPLQSMLFTLKHLVRLDISIKDPWKATGELCTSLCDLIKQGRLEVLKVHGSTVEQGLFCSLLDAVNESASLTQLRLQDLKKHVEVDVYHDKMLRILEQNTQLKVALICGDIVTSGHLFEDSDDQMRAHVNREWFLDRTKGNNKQRRIDYLTLLNICGRGEVKAEGTQLKDIVHTISLEAMGDKVDFLGFTGEARMDLITILRYGLLHQQPAAWLEQKPQPVANDDTN